MIGSVSILGCGWLGLPLASFLRQKGFIVKGSSTTKEKLAILEEKKIKSFLLHFDDEEVHEIEEEASSFFQCDLLIINIPPKVSSSHEDFHPQQIRQIIGYIHQYKIPKVIYVSATSVYPVSEEVVDEETEVNLANTGSKALFKAEQLLRKETSFTKNILRCGGLLGYDRIPGRYFMGKTLDTGHTPVNYIHQDDVIAIIYLIIKRNIWNRTYNLVAPSHPTRQEVFLKNALDFNFAPPKFIPPVTQRVYKLVLGEKAIIDLQYEFLYPDPLLFHYTS